jgi:F-type H+-transporting ATPase subunit b
VLVVTQAGAVTPQVRFVLEQDAGTTAAETKEPPNPILPVKNEIIYAFVGFIVLLVLMRYWLFPALKKGMDARYAMIQAGHESADALRASAQAEADAYDAGLAEARAEAATYLEAARQDVETDRQQKLAAVNARIAERKAAAAQENEAAKAGAQGAVEDAVADVAASIAGRALSREIDPGSVRGIVSEVVHAGVSQ